MNTMKNPFAVIAIALLMTACGKESEPGPDPKTANNTPPPETAPTAGESVSINVVLAEYESVRALLANDSTTGVRDHAARLGDVAAALASDASADAKPHLEAIAAAAAELAGGDGELPTARLAFGNVSKALVALREATPELAADSHLFECPMAKGYKRWIQPTAKLENPYMGQKMLGCGSEIAATE